MTQRDTHDPLVYSKAVIGYRRWMIRDGKLGAWGRVGAPSWEPGVNEARCVPVPDLDPDTFTRLVRPRHAAPAPDCNCGFNAYHEPVTSSRTDRAAVGAIAAWGDMEVHRDGFRAQYAQVVALCTPPYLADECDLLPVAEYYGVPLVASMYELEAVARHGESLPESAYPDPEPDRSAILHAISLLSDTLLGAYWKRPDRIRVTQEATIGTVDYRVIGDDRDPFQWAWKETGMRRPTEILVHPQDWMTICRTTTCIGPGVTWNSLAHVDTSVTPMTLLGIPVVKE